MNKMILTAIITCLTMSSFQAFAQNVNSHEMRLQRLELELKMLQQQVATLTGKAIEHSWVCKVQNPQKVIFTSKLHETETKAIDDVTEQCGKTLAPSGEYCSSMVCAQVSQ